MPTGNAAPRPNPASDPYGPDVVSMTQSFQDIDLRPFRNREYWESPIAYNAAKEGWRDRRAREYERLQQENKILARKPIKPGGRSLPRLAGDFETAPRDHSRHIYDQSHPAWETSRPARGQLTAREYFEARGADSSGNDRSPTETQRRSLRLRQHHPPPSRLHEARAELAAAEENLAAAKHTVKHQHLKRHHGDFHRSVEYWSGRVDIEEKEERKRGECTFYHD